ncbi:ABC transporter ATP-binding protein [Candidatus Uhrbacteria bacterium]|nr:ABC transporter ATP-binding protein [Candidatus Uhrbacteria bacterium]
MKISINDVNKVYWQHIKPYLGSMAIIIGSIIGATVMHLSVPWFYKLFFDVLFGDTEPFGGTVKSTLLLIVVLIFLVGTCVNIFWRISGFVTAHVQTSVTRDLERSSYSYLLDHSYKFFTDSFAGGLLRKVRRLSRSFETVMDKLQWSFLPLIVSIIGIVIILWTRSPLLSIFTIIWIVLFTVLNVLFSKWKLKYDEERSEVDSEVTSVLADGITNSTNIKLFGGHGFEMGLFGDVSRKYQKLKQFTWNLNEINNAIQGVLLAILELVIMYYAIDLWLQGVLTAGDFALLQGYTVMIIRKMWDIGRYIRDTYEAYAEAKEMVEILNTPHAIRNTKSAKSLEVTGGEIKFENVEFSYAKTRKVIDKMSLKIKHNERVAFVGPSGAGKSTIVKLLFRLFDIQRGKILIDGQRLTKVTHESLRENISLVPQEPILFHRSLMENIQYGRRDASKEEVIAAAKKARCHDFIMDLSSGYDTLVGERGVKLSGGERQRVAIARAILKDAPILVLDEATSSLDSESEVLIQEALEELMKGRTTIVIAHRLSTILKMDRIIVMEQGNVVDTGTHKQLSRKKGIYKTLWDIQVGGFIQ